MLVLVAAALFSVVLMSAAWAIVRRAGDGERTRQVLEVCLPPGPVGGQ